MTVDNVLDGVNIIRNFFGRRLDGGSDQSLVGTYTDVSWTSSERCDGMAMCNYFTSTLHFFIR